MAKYYSWSNFSLDIDEHGKAKKVIGPGVEVTAEKLKVTKDEFDVMIESGVVRTQRYPDIPDFQSPTEYYRELTARLASGQSVSEDMELIQQLIGSGMELTPDGVVEAPEPASETGLAGK
jgi:hypothetical protein